MIVTAALAWWNEKPEDLRACVLSLRGIVDRLVAADGAYSRYPNATISSPEEQYAALKEAAAEARIQAQVYTPGFLWAGQVEKRTFLLRNAASGSDWVLVLDADHIVHAEKPRAVREALEAMHVGTRTVGVPFATPTNDKRELEDSAATNWHLAVAGTTLCQAVFFRAMEDFTVVRKHFIYEGLYAGFKHTVRYGGKADVELPANMVIEHRTLFRSEEQIKASRAFLNDRELVVGWTGQEDDQPELPRPSFDYDTRPYPHPRRPAQQPQQQREDEQPIRRRRIKVTPDVNPDPNYPIRAHTLGTLESGLRKGRKVFFRLDRSSIGVFDPGVKPSDGDVVCAVTRDKPDVGRKEGDMLVTRSWTRRPSETLGTVIWTGAREDGYVPPAPPAPSLTDAPARPAEVVVHSVREPKAEPVKRKPGRPAGSKNKSTRT